MLLPARLDETRDKAFRAELPQRDTAHPQLAVIGLRAAGDLAPVVNARRRRIARQLRELERRRKAVLGRPTLVARDLFEPRAPAREFLRQPAPPVVLLDRAFLRHSGLLIFRV